MTSEAQISLNPRLSGVVPYYWLLFGNFTLELDILSDEAKSFSVTNRFIRSSFSEITSIPFGISSLEYSTPRQTR
jgi:hypothetical protein